MEVFGKLLVSDDAADAAVTMIQGRAVNRVRQEFQNKCIPKFLGGDLHFSRSYRIRLSQYITPKSKIYLVSINFLGMSSLNSKLSNPQLY